MAAIFLLFSVFAQAHTQPAIVFDSSDWNFGDIREDGGSVEHTFTFTNKSGKPVVILDVTTGCGCTTPTYSRKPVMAGEKGTIKVKFDPMSRPGRFVKGVSILTSLSSSPVALTLQGNVIPRKKSIEELYPFDMGGGVRLSSNFVTFAYVGRGERVSEPIGWINTSSRDATFKMQPKESSGLLTIGAPAVMKAGQKGEFDVAYAVAQSSDRYGTLNDVLDVVVNGRTARSLFTASAVAIDRFDAAPDDIMVPNSDISKKIIKFGDVKHGSKVVDASLTLANNGERDLIIRAVEWQSKALECSLKAGDIVKAGQKVTLKFTLDSSQCDYDLWVDRVRIITNDVQHPMQSIRLTGVVVE
jgi:hypothetical protein